MLSFEVDSEETAKQVLEGISLFNSLKVLVVQNPCWRILWRKHILTEPEDAERKGITRRLLRLSVGIEDTEDLIADLETGF